MTFTTFLLYLLGGLAIIIVGYYALCLAVFVVVKATMWLSDWAENARNKRGASKWERTEKELDDDD
jgi:hypothetical protein